MTIVLPGDGTAVTAAPVSSSTTFPTLGMRRLSLVAGGVLSAAGHLLHPVDHEAASRAVDRFGSVHLLFIAGAMLLVAGFPAVRERLGGDRYAALVVGALSAATMLIGTLVSLEAFASKYVDQATFDRISASTDGLSAVAMVCMVVGTAGVGVLGWRRNRLARPVSVVLVVTALLLFFVPALPGTEGYWVIGTLAAMNLAYAASARDVTVRR